MPEPVSATATAIALIGAGAATVGAVQATSSMATDATGFNVGRAHIHYPKEFPSELFAHAGQSVDWDIIKFKAIGFFSDNDLAVSCTGYMSKDSNPLQGRPGSN